MSSNMPQRVIAELAPTGVLSAGIHPSIFCWSGRRARGVAPDMAREIGQRLSAAVVDVLQ
jgi:hypothetical protein